MARSSMSASKRALTAGSPITRRRSSGAIAASFAKDPVRGPRQPRIGVSDHPLRAECDDLHLVRRLDRDRTTVVRSATIPGCVPIWRAVGESCAGLMARALDTSALSQDLATAVWPWIDIVETARSEMANRVRLTAENTAACLRSRIAMTPPLETALDDALHASDALARDLDQVSFFQSDARTEALLALNALIIWLQATRPNANTKEIGPSE